MKKFAYFSWFLFYSIQTVSAQTTTAAGTATTGTAQTTTGGATTTTPGSTPGTTGTTPTVEGMSKMVSDYNQLSKHAPVQRVLFITENISTVILEISWGHTFSQVPFLPPLLPQDPQPPLLKKPQNHSRIYLCVNVQNVVVFKV